MNYFAHGRPFVDDPYYLAGTAVPDWMNVADRRVRVRERYATKLVDDPDPRVASLARGIVQHHRDDAWFHETRAFTELSWATTVTVRDALPVDDGFRPSFLGHILVEILLDATLIASEPDRLDQYYAAMDELDGELVESAINRMVPHGTQRLAPLIPLFSRERFLFDYLDDAKLTFRLNQVMRRVKLTALPPSFQAVLPKVRREVTARCDELLAAPPSTAPTPATADTNHHDD